MDSTDRTIRSIGIIWDKDYPAHIYINQCVSESDSWQELSSKLQLFYETSIDAVLSEVPENWIGHQLIREQVNYHPRDVFDDLARQYWRDMKETA